MFFGEEAFTKFQNNIAVSPDSGKISLIFRNYFDKDQCEFLK